MPRRPNRFADFIRLDPMRSPRWRYDRVRQLLDHRPAPLQPVRNRDDRYIREARTFILEWERIGRTVRPTQLADERRKMFPLNPELYFAVEMLFSPHAERTRAEVEARLLAGQNNDEISEHVTSLPGTIEYYEKLFFNVRDRLKNKGYIVNRIIQPTCTLGWDELNLEMSSKFFGYFGGPVVLDAVLHAFDDTLGQPLRGDSPGDFFVAHLNGGVQRRLSEVVNAFDINKYNIVELLEVHTQLLKIAREAKAAEGNLDTTEHNLAVLLQSVHFAVTPEQHKEALEHSPLKPYHGISAELRAHESLRLVSGEPLPQGLEELKTLKMPPRKSTLNPPPAANP